MFAGTTIVGASLHPPDRNINKNYFERRRFLRIKAIFSRFIKMTTARPHSPSGSGACDLFLLLPIPRCGIVFAGGGLKILSILIRATGRSLIFWLEGAAATAHTRAQLKHLDTFQSKQC